MDPSLRRTGLSLMDTTSKTVNIMKFEFKQAMRNLSFNGVLERAIDVKRGVLGAISS